MHAFRTIAIDETNTAERIEDQFGETRGDPRNTGLQFTHGFEAAFARLLVAHVMSLVVYGLCAGNKPGRLGRHHVLCTGCSLVLGLGLLRRAHRCEY